MNPTGVPQPQNVYNQFPTADPSTAPPAPQYEKDSSSYISQMSQCYGYSGSQGMAHGRLGPPPDLASQQQYPLQPQQGSRFFQPSASPIQQFLSAPSSQYTLNRNAQILAALQPPPLQEYAGSQAVHQIPLQSYPLTTPAPNFHPVPHEIYSERENATSFRGVQGLVLGEDLGSHKGGNSGGISMRNLTCQNAQGSLAGPSIPSFEGHGYSQAPKHRTQQSIMNQTDASLGLEPSGNFPRQYGTDATNETFGPNGMRVSLPLHSVINKHEAGGDMGSQIGNSATVANNIGPRSQWLDSREIGNQANPYPTSMPGIDPPLITNDMLEECRRFSADVNETDPGESDVQNEYPNDLDNAFSYGPPASGFSRSDTLSTETFPRAASKTTPCSHRRNRRQSSSAPSQTTCKTCDDDPDCERKPVYTGSTESQKTSLAKHKRRKHSDSAIWFHQCLLFKDGSACTKVLELAESRRRHVEIAHTTVSRELPPKDTDKRNPNAETDAMLDAWFARIPPTSSR